MLILAWKWMDHVQLTFTALDQNFWFWLIGPSSDDKQQTNPIKAGRQAVLYRAYSAAVSCVIVPTPPIVEMLSNILENSINIFIDKMELEPWPEWPLWQLEVLQAFMLQT